MARNFFSWTNHDKKINFWLFWIQKEQIVISFMKFYWENWKIRNPTLIKKCELQTQNCVSSGTIRAPIEPILLNCRLNCIRFLLGQFLKKCWKILERTLLHQKLLSVFLVFLWKYTWWPICTCWIRKSQKFIFYHVLSRKKILAILGPKTSDKKIQKMKIFKANPRLVKIVIVQKSYWHTILGPLFVRKCQKLGLYWS
jgi:hypothetical protein